MLEELDFAQSALGENLLAEDIGDLLDGNAFVCLIVYGSTGGSDVRSSFSYMCECVWYACLRHTRATSQ